MSEKLFNSGDILKLVSKIEKRIDKLECWIQDCCAKIPINIGNGIGLFKKYYKGKWQFKSILAGNNVTITEQENTITINSTGGGGSFTCEDVNDCLGISEAGNPVYFLNQQGDWDTISLTGTENRILYFNGLGELETSPQLSYGSGELFLSNNISGGYFYSFSGGSSIGVTSSIGTPGSYDSRFYTTSNFVGWEVPFLSADSFRLPITDGNSGDVMTTDGLGNITFQPVSGSGFTCTDLNSCSTTNLPEGTNLYFTNSRAITALTGQNISLFTNDSGYITSSALSPYLTSATAALTYYPLTNPSGYTSNTGTVTTLSVATANGFSGTVSNPSTTPEITIDVSGLDVSKLADGTVSNTEFQYINSLTSNAQTQLDNRPILISTATASTTATIDFTLSSSYKSFEIRCISVVPSTDNVGMWVRVSTDGGSTFASGASDYIYQRYYQNGSSSLPSLSAADSKIILLGSGIGNGSGRYFNSIIRVYDASNSSINKNITAEFHMYRSDSIYTLGILNGVYQFNTAINAIRILMSSGNIASGTFELWGYK